MLVSSELRLSVQGDGDCPQQALQTDPCDWSAPTSRLSTGPARNGDQTHMLGATRVDGHMDTGDVDCLPGVQGNSRPPPSSTATPTHPGPSVPLTRPARGASPLCWSRARVPRSSACSASTTGRRAHWAATPLAWRKGQWQLHQAEPEHWPALPTGPEGTGDPCTPGTGAKGRSTGVRNTQQCSLHNRVARPGGPPWRGRDWGKDL